MTEYMTAMVEEHLDCVNKVISKRIHIPKAPLLEYDDLYQVGYMALCKTAMNYIPGCGEFGPFACTVIYNGIIANPCTFAVAGR